MSEVTHILNAIEAGDPQAAAQLLPLVYDELRLLAAQRLAQEKPGQTLEATALVHEAYLRLVGDGQGQRWDHRGHFFAAAAEAMRRILVDTARHKKAVRHGGGRRRVALHDHHRILQSPDDLAASALGAGNPDLSAERARDREVVHERMNEWLSDKDLAGVREDPWLAKLPAEEREQWRTLWDNVRFLRDRTAPGKAPAKP